MSVRLNLDGKTFGRITVISSFVKNSSTYCHCICSCGSKKDILATCLKRGGSKSCGCLNVEVTKKSNTKHGLADSRFNIIHRNMVRRCYNTNDQAYPRYGGRGITVCDRWLKFQSFIEDMHESYLKHVEEFGEKNTTIDRIDSNGNYCKENCKWSTFKEQQNNRTNNMLITYNGETLTPSQWSDKTGINCAKLRRRIVRTKMSLEDIFNKP